ncbi:S-layer homology domain-containing protein [Paenibacillus lemnae]|uniref:SLH domain-containing protein n=1 Tax=Paenibacillus lemnae TaxID=1330551 RepID=A0A848M3D0_PAELE|nr:S-layer homology domain-containing protein [Paenibacillus lemnae]NMO95086.1 hypothetical protein [Paenibacillus lemnae]
MKRLGRVLLSVCLLLGALSGWTGEKAVFGNSGASPVDPKLSAGFYHAVSLVSSGEVYSWGQNTKGQLGNESTVSRSGPVRTKGLTDVIEIATGARSSMALKRDGTVWSWGANEQGELGIGTEVNVNVPVQVQGLPAIRAIAGSVGYHMLALDEEGEVWGWGRNDDGEVGDGTLVKRTSPVKVQGLSGVVQIAAGEYNSLALKSDGTVWAWGHNGYGELGDGTRTNRSLAVQVNGLNDVKSISAGTFFSLALKNDGTVWAWGRNIYGTLGDGSRSDRSLPVQVQNLQDITKISAGAHHSLALDADGNVWGWGANNHGQLGQGNELSTTVPLQAAGIDSVIDIAAGGYFSLALKDSGILWAWGYGRGGEMADNTANSRNLPAVTKAVLDTTAPVPSVSQLNVVETEPGTVEVNWDAANDNLTATDQLEYMLYVSTSAVIDTVARIERHGAPLGSYAPASLQQMVYGLEPGKTYYFNVIVRDRAGYKAAYTVKPFAAAKPKLYTVTYDGNESTAGSVPTDNGIYAEGDVVTVSGNTGGLSRDGYEFIGWNTAADGTGNAYTPGDKLLISDHHVTLYAVWRVPSVDPPDPDPAVEVFLEQLDLESSAGTVDLTPAFSSSVHEYTASLRHDSDHVSVTADVYDSRTVVTAGVYGQDGEVMSGPVMLLSGVKSPALPIPSGTSSIKVEVSAASGEKLVYMVTVIREAEPGSEVPGDGEGDGVGDGGGDNDGDGSGDDEGSPSPPETPSPGSGGVPVSGGSGSPVPGDSTILPEQLKIVSLVNDQALSGIVTGTVKQENNRTAASLILDGTRLAQAMAANTGNADVFINVPGKMDEITLDLDNSALELLHSRKGIIKLYTEIGQLTLPVHEIPSPAAAGLLLKSVSPPSVNQVQENAASIQLSVVGEEDQANISQEAMAQGYRLLGVPVELAVWVSSGDGLESVANFSRMVELRIPRPEETGGGRITTAAAWKAGKELRHVPANMKPQDGEVLPEVVLSTLAPGTFVLLQEISSPVFRDLRGHWSEPAVKSLASKMIVQGYDGHLSVNYAPDAPVTRAELLAIMVRAFGLKSDPSSDTGLKASPFTDVKASDWFYDAAGAAYEYGIVQGYRDAAFRPLSPITRQEAMVLMMRLSETAGGGLMLSQDQVVLTGYTDKNALSPWAERAATLLIQHGVIQGSSQQLRPAGILTRAEAAVMTERLLVKTGLIESRSF